MTDGAIATAGLTKDFGGGRGIFDLDLSVREGEVFGFIGPNGAGKTTTLRLLLALLRPTRGRATIHGLDTERDAVAVKRLVGWVPGEPPDYPNHRAGQLLDFLAHLHGGVAPGAVPALAERLGLDLGQKYRSLSHGNRQKVWLVQAFMHEPRVLLLDEPTNGLDPLAQETFRELVGEATRRGATVFLSSHVLSEVEQLCQRVGVIHAGRLRRVGSIAELRIGHAHRIAALVQTAVDAHDLAALPGVDDVAVEGTSVRCRVTGPIGPVMAVLQSAGLLSLESTAMSLEEVFLREYGAESAA